MTCHHPSREARYQISALLKAGMTQARISVNLGRHKSANGQKISRNSGLRSYRPGQACFLAENRAPNSRNARPIADSDWLCFEGYLSEQWSPGQITSEFSMSHETIYRHVYAEKARGGDLHKSLRRQRKRRKRYAGAHDRRGQIRGRRPICERPRHIEGRRQIGRREGDTLIGKGHKHAIVSLVERKNG
jgi:IS30 family transposase